MKKAVLFDLDGTLIDTAPDFIRIVQNMCREAEIPVLDADLIRARVSEGARAMVKLVYPSHLDEATFLKHRDRFLSEYQDNIAVDTQLFDGMDELLQDLEQRAIPWGIVTNKPRYLSEILLDALDLKTRCAVLVCPDDVHRTKPDPEPMYLAASQLDLDAEDIIYVGDHPRDIDAGRSADMLTILAGYGYLPHDAKDDLDAWNADYIVHTVEQLHAEIEALISP